MEGTNRTTTIEIKVDPERMKRLLDRVREGVERRERARRARSRVLRERLPMRARRFYDRPLDVPGKGRPIAPSSFARIKAMSVMMSPDEKESFAGSVKLKLKRTWYSRWQPFALQTDDPQGEITRYSKAFEEMRGEWDDKEAKPLRSPTMEVGMTSPFKREVKYETNERDVTMDELAQMEMEESRNERERYRDQE